MRADALQHEWARLRDSVRKLEAAGLTAKQDTVRRTMDALAKEAARLAEEAGRSIGDVAKAIADAANVAQQAPAFDLPEPAPSAEKTAEEKSSDAAGLAISKLIENAPLNPAAAISTALVQNSVQATFEMQDNLVGAITDFMTTDGAELERAINAFPDRILGPATMFRIIADHVIGGATAYAKDELKDIALPTAEEISEKIATAFKGTWAAHYFGGGARDTKSFIWLEWGEGKERNTDLVRDDRGTPLLFNRKGERALFDATRNRTTYEVSDLDRMAEKYGLDIRRHIPSEWRINAAFFAPEKTSSAGTEWVQNWIVSQALAPAVAMAEGAKSGFLNWLRSP